MTLIDKDNLIRDLQKEFEALKIFFDDSENQIKPIESWIFKIIDKQPEIEIPIPEKELEGKTIYRFRITGSVNRYKKHQPIKKIYSSLLDSEELAKSRIHDPGTSITIEERIGVKTDKLRLGKVAFLTREEAEAQLQKWKDNNG